MSGFPVMYVINFSRLFFNADAVCPETVTACEGRRSSFSRVPGFGGSWINNAVLPPYWMPWSAPVPVLDTFAVLELTGALKLLTSTVLFGPLGAGNGVLSSAIRTLSGVSNANIRITSPAFLPLLEIGKSFVDLMFDPNMWGDESFLEHQNGLDQGCDSR